MEQSKKIPLLLAFFHLTYWLYLMQFPASVSSPNKITVVVCIFSAIALENIDAFLSVSPTVLRVVRVFRVFRVLRLVRAARGIRRLVLTLKISFSALFDIAVLLGLFLVIFAILGKLKKRFDKVIVNSKQCYKRIVN